MHVQQLLAVLRQLDALAVSVLRLIGVLHAPPKWRQVARLLETLDGRLPPRRQHDVPRRECPQHECYDARDDTQHDVLDGHEVLDVGYLVDDLVPGPRAGHQEAVYAKHRRVDEEQQEGLVVS